ncbi:WD40 repeat domain-containing protein [Zavarzinella formosa]|uniref:WD40 repeat domain-containing protein n=1 Tax=Zavarzinella formosa TaxID=360055 RepID=UPI00035CF29A|nr:WD40 repeat domain-containing protein [Zavarzinella formosa]
MKVLNAPGGVTQLRFLPDGQRLIVEANAWFHVLTIETGESIPLSSSKKVLPADWNFRQSHEVAVPSAGDWFYVIGDGYLRSFLLKDCSPRPVPEIHNNFRHVAVSASADRVLAVVPGTYSGNIPWKPMRLCAIDTSPTGDQARFDMPLPPEYQRLVGILPDGKRFVTLEDMKIRIRDLSDGRELASGKHKIHGGDWAQLSPDGRHVGTLGRHSMYVTDLEPLAKPRLISGSSNNNNFISFAFHPANGTMAVIHGGPTLVKIYDVATLKQTLVYKWKLGPLGAVTFSPDGLLGAAGSADGQIVIWDVD